MNFDWNELAFASKKPLDKLKAVFIAAPREMSATRFTQLVREYLPNGNIVLGLAKEDYITGFENQPQFKTLQAQTVQAIIDKVNSSKTPHKIYTLRYFQREIVYIFEKLNFKKVVLINGSWRQAFHTRPEYYVLASKHANYDMVSPFASEQEAQTYAVSVLPAYKKPVGDFSETDMMKFASLVAKRSFDYSFQTGVSIGRKKGKKYTYLLSTFNPVVPYQTYAMHHGALREKNFSPPNDLNYYDTVHAEVAAIIEAQKRKIDLHDTTLFINLLPCPTCARMFSETDISEFVYASDHSNGYAIKFLAAAGKKVRRLV